MSSRLKLRPEKISEQVGLDMLKTTFLKMVAAFNKDKQQEEKIIFGKDPKKLTFDNVLAAIKFYEDSADPIFIVHFLDQVTTRLRRYEIEALDPVHNSSIEEIALCSAIVSSKLCVDKAVWNSDYLNELNGAYSVSDLVKCEYHHLTYLGFTGLFKTAVQIPLDFTFAITRLSEALKFLSFKNLILLQNATIFSRMNMYINAVFSDRIKLRMQPISTQVEHKRERSFSLSSCAPTLFFATKKLKPENEQKKSRPRSQSAIVLGSTQRNKRNNFGIT